MNKTIIIASLLVATNAFGFELSQDEYMAVAAMHGAEYYVLAGKCPGLRIDFEDMKNKHGVFTQAQREQIDNLMPKVSATMAQAENKGGAAAVCSLIRNQFVGRNSSSIIVNQ